MSAALETPVAAASSQASVDLAKVDLQAVALAHFGDWRKAVADATTKLSSTVHDLSTQAKVDEAKSLRWRLSGQPLADARKTSVALKSKLTAVSKAVGAELELIEAGYTAAAVGIGQQIDKREAELEAEREAKRKAEAERVAKLQAGVAAIRAFAAHAMSPGMTAERIGAGMARLQAMVFREEVWQEFAATAAAARDETLALMLPLRQGALEREAEAKRLEEQRTELAARSAALAAQEAHAGPQDQRGKAPEPETAGTGGASDETAQPATPPAPTITTETPKEGGSSPADEPAAGTPAKCASSEAQAAQASPSGEDGGGAAAVTGSPIPDEPATIGGNKPRFAAGAGHGIFVVDAAPVPDNSRIKLGTICERLGFTMTASFVADILNVHHVGTDKAAKLYTETQFQEICRALVGHISEVAKQEGQP